MPQPFANLDGLLRLSYREGVDISRPLLRVLTDLYVQEKSHTREEEQQYVELVLRLLPATDVATRIAVARKLAAYRQTPAPILEALRKDKPEVAACISPPTSIANADIEVATAPLAEPSDHSIPVIAAEEIVASPVHEWPISAGGLGDDFLRADRAGRAALLKRLNSPVTGREPTFDLLVRPGARERLERAALARDPHEFARELRLSLGISSRVAFRIVQDDSGEPLAVAARMLDIAPDAFTRILLFLNPRIGESVERVFALVKLYRELTPAAGVPVLASWR
ncbi:MAG TPA: hypothetical protein VHG33_00845, partial [Woeseiaceae bacterium]|nr:hypothetical protein [Woeseiaceae bacterium]